MKEKTVKTSTASAEKSVIWKISQALIGLGINAEKLGILIVGSKAINLELHRLVCDQIYLQRALKIRLTQLKSPKHVIVESVKEDERENQHTLIDLANKLEIVNAFLELSFNKKSAYHLATIEYINVADESVENIAEIYRQTCFDLIEAINNISLNIEVYLRRPETQINLGGVNIDKAELVEKFKELKEYRHAVCQIINIQRELDSFAAHEVTEKKTQSRIKRPKKIDVEKRDLGSDFRVIFLNQDLEREDINCQTIVNLEKLFQEQSPTLRSVIDRGFKFATSDNEKSDYFISDGIEWERYRKNSVVRFSYDNYRKIIWPLPSLSKEQLLSVLADGFNYFERLMALLERTKQIYFELKLNEIWPDYKEIVFSRTDWSDISVNALEGRLQAVKEIAKDNLNGARYMFKEKILEGILYAPSERLIPPREMCPKIPLYA